MLWLKFHKQQKFIVNLSFFRIQQEYENCLIYYHAGNSIDAK